MKKNLLLLLFASLISGIPISTFADNQAKIDTGDTAFSIFSITLVFLMTIGLALFYGGMVRKKNVLNTMLNSFIIIGLVSIQWVLIGYSLAFGNDHWGLLGGLNWFGFNGVGATPNADYAMTIPHSAFAMFQLMFAIITPALITGSFAERMRFPAFVAFVLLWATFVYDPLAHWVWGNGGWLRSLGALDFAGGTVVHISSGIAGLMTALFIGKRKGFLTSPIIPHNIPFVLIGGGLLWFGWFGFNAGSALAANGLALTALITTNTAAAAALLSWITIEYYHHGKTTLLGAVTGAVIGLVAITPGAGYVTPAAAIIIGLLVSPICYFSITYVKAKFRYDDSLDVFGCHGVGGMWGAIATGLFASKAVNPLGADGLFYGNPNLLLIQLIGVLSTIVFSGLGTLLILKVVSLFTSLRVSENCEDEGLDTAQHGEDAYPDFVGGKKYNIIG